MAKCSPRRSTPGRRVGPQTSPSGLIEWPKDKAAAAALVAAARQIGAELNALLPTVRDEAQWQSATVACLRAVIDYEDAHADARHYVGSRRSYSDDFRRFVLGLVGPGQPGEGMSIAALAYATDVPADVLTEWLDSPTPT